MMGRKVWRAYPDEATIDPALANKNDGVDGVCTTQSMVTAAAPLHPHLLLPRVGNHGGQRWR